MTRTIEISVKKSMEASYFITTQALNDGVPLYDATVQYPHISNEAEAVKLQHKLVAAHNTSCKINPRQRDRVAVSA